MAQIHAFRVGQWLFGVLVLLMLVGTSQAEEAPLAPAPQESPDYSAMADLLEDEASRNRLIAELRALSAGEEEVESLAEELDISLSAPVELAAEARDLVGSVTGEIAQAVDAVVAIDFSERTGTWADFMAAGFNLAIAVLVSMVVYILVHKLFDRVHERTAEWVSSGSRRTRILRELGGALIPLVTALVAIALAWVSAYAVALYALSPEGKVPQEVAVFLNAFLIVETIRVVLENLLSPRLPRLRLLPLRSSSARYWNRLLGWLIGFLGYGLLVASPLASETLSPALGQVIALALVLISYLAVITLIIRNRGRVRRRLQWAAKGAAMGLSRLLLGAVARAWHVLAILYVTALVLVAINQPQEGLPAMARATLQTLLAIGLGGLLSSILTRLIGRNVTLPAYLRRWSPALERQVNHYLPTWMKVIRVIITLIVIAVILDAWTGFDLGAWAESGVGAWVLESAIAVAFIVTVAVLLWILATSWIERRLTTEGPTTAARARERTLLGLFRNAIAIAITVITVMIVLSELGINIAPLIASAGVLGLAIGFGAQKLVQDIITGVFIQLENAINTGDVVTVGGYSGEAEKLTLRSLGLRDLEGTYHIIPFSSVDTVSNFMRGFSFHLGQYGIAYREDTDHALEHLKAAFEELKANPDQGPFILEDLDIHGVTELGDSAVTLRVRIKTMPGKQWGVGREYNRLVKRHFDAAGIEIPYPHTTLYFGQDKDGTAPPAPVKLLRDSAETTQPGRPDKDSSDAEEAQPNPEEKND